MAVSVLSACRGGGAAPDWLKEPPPENDAQKSIRTMATQGQAAPTDLTAALIPPAGVLLRWKRHATDADGYPLEIKPSWGSDFKVSAFLPADKNSLTSYSFPFETKFALRVRAFFYGEPSNLAEQTTGPDPARESPR